MINREPGQVRKEAAAAVTSCAGVWLVGLPPAHLSSPIVYQAFQSVDSDSSEFPVLHSIFRTFTVSVLSLARATLRIDGFYSGMWNLSIVSDCILTSSIEMSMMAQADPFKRVIMGIIRNIRSRTTADECVVKQAARRFVCCLLI